MSEQCKERKARWDGSSDDCVRKVGHVGIHVDAFGNTWLSGFDHVPAEPNHYAGGPTPCRCDECLDSQPKLRYDLIPEPALTAMAHAFTIGTKHGNGIKVESAAHEYAAILRHLEAWRRGETVDPEDGHLHLAAGMARLAKLIATETKWEGE